MKLCNDELETKSEHDMFIISIKQESDVSIDGGYTFEDVKNSCALDRHEALDLYKELKIYLLNNRE